VISGCALVMLGTLVKISRVLVMLWVLARIRLKAEAYRHPPIRCGAHLALAGSLDGSSLHGAQGVFAR